MPSIKNKPKGTENITEPKKLRDYSKEPFFVEKAKKAKEYIEKHGLIEQIEKLSKNK